MSANTSTVLRQTQPRFEYTYFVMTAAEELWAGREMHSFEKIDDDWGGRYILARRMTWRSASMGSNTVYVSTMSTSSNLDIAPHDVGEQSLVAFVAQGWAHFTILFGDAVIHEVVCTLTTQCLRSLALKLGPA